MDRFYVQRTAFKEGLVYFAFIEAFMLLAFVLIIRALSISLSEISAFIVVLSSALIAFSAVFMYALSQLEEFFVASKTLQIEYLAMILVLFSMLALMCAPFIGIILVEEMLIGALLVFALPLQPLAKQL